MKRPWKIGSAVLAVAVAVATVGGCGSKGSEGSSSSGGSQETEAKAQYNETKQMVLDILHTKEGLDTLKDIVRDPQFKNSLAINEADVSVAMQHALTDGSAHFTLMEQMRNPKFATAMAATFKKDNEKILKDLMKDPEYQEMMLTLLKSPDYQRTLYDLMKTPEYRKQTMEIMTQSLQNPQFRLIYMDLLKQTIQQGTTEMTPNQKKASGQEPQELTTPSDQEKSKEGEGGGEKKKEEGGGDEKKKEDSGDGGGEGEGGGGGGKK